MVSTGIVRAARAAAAEGFDALAIGCFYDTALHEAREVSADMVVTAPCAASLKIAAFGIIGDGDVFGNQPGQPGRSRRRIGGTHAERALRAP